MTDSCCEKCTYWEPQDENKKLGDCRRYPPFLNRLGNSVSPLTLPAHWCGEWVEQKK